MVLLMNICFNDFFFANVSLSVPFNEKECQLLIHLAPTWVTEADSQSFCEIGLKHWELQTHTIAPDRTFISPTQNKVPMP